MALSAGRVVGDVEGAGHCIATECLDLLCHRFCPPGDIIVHENLGPSRRERAGDRAPHSLPCTRDECDPAAEVDFESHGMSMSSTATPFGSWTTAICVPTESVIRVGVPPRSNEARRCSVGSIWV